jgi:hypothetical protein
VSRIIGVELLPAVARAVAVDRWRSRAAHSLEMAWNPARPAELVAQLRARLGSASRIALSIGVGFLHLKHVKLPPAGARERRRILMFEPDRFFAVHGDPLVVSLLDAESFAFAADAASVESWVAAFEEWAPVECVEAAPLSLARALGRNATGTFVLPAGPDETGLAELKQGSVSTARRVPAGTAPDASVPPARRGVPGEWLCAYGAALGADQPLAALLVSDAIADRIRRRRIGRLAVAAVLCAVAVSASIWSLERSRERLLQQIRAEVAALTTRAEPAMTLQSQLVTLERESMAIRELSRRRANPLRVLQALGQHLPADATVLNLRAQGDSWQIDGTAANAAAILPLLAADERFENVRFLSASSRFREGTRTYETYSIAFRVRPAD